jgi:hypothetical protein
MRLTTWAAAVAAVAVVLVGNAALGNVLTRPAGASSAPLAPVPAAPAPAAAPAAPAAPPAPAAPAVVPGTDPSVQQWWSSYGRAKVQFNEALQEAQTGVAARTSASCQPLNASVTAMLGTLPQLRLLPNGGTKLADQLTPPLTTFGAAAKACLAGDFTGAQGSLATGAAQQVAAQAEIDEILEGEL